MSWPTITVEGWPDFIQIVERLTLGPAAKPNYLARGQSDREWELAPTLNRQIPEGFGYDQVVSLERDLHNEFVSQARNHVSSDLLGSRYNQLQKWAVMQHHGAPTRLLDWTLSLFVAAYFAVDSDWDPDGAVWYIHAGSLEVVMKREFDTLTKSGVAELLFKETAPEAVMPFFPDLRTSRMAAQQGCFTVAANPMTLHESALARVLQLQDQSEGELLRKVLIPSRLKPAFLRRLRMMNITANALFPGVDGLGRSVNELLRLSTTTGQGTEAPPV